MLQVHRAERADRLVDALAELLAEPPVDPFAHEVVAVPARGVERWLTQRLATRLGARAAREDGICAAVRHPTPARLIEDAVALASGIAPEADPWRPERSVWPLLELIEGALGEPWLVALADYLGRSHGREEAHRRSRRLAVVRHLAALFHRYALHRPDLLAAWEHGELPSDCGLGPGSSAAWQAELWRRLHTLIALPDPAQRLAPACERIERCPALLELPARLSVFGLTRMPAAQLQVLRALACGRDVHLFLLHPSPVLWARAAAVSAAAHAGPCSPAPARDEDPTAGLPRNPLLRSWGRDARELALLLRCSGPLLERHHPLAPTPGPATLLARLQAAVREDAPPPGPPLPGSPERRPALALEDDSVRIHACYGRARQVEVLREAVLHALAEDPTLEPREVIVMCPEIESFAPLIQAAFSAGEAHAERDDRAPQDAPSAEQSERAAAGAEAIRLRVRLADRSLRQTNPLLSLAAELLELADGRLSASQVLDLADREPVRRRFGFDDQELTRLRSWTAEAAIRWGLDAEHRAPFGLERLAAGTWRAGLDRLLLGVALSEDGQRRFAGVLPLDDLDSGSIDLAGRFAELVERLGRALDSLRAPQPLGAWARQLRAAIEALSLTPTREGWQRTQLARLLDELAGEAGGCTVALELAEVRAMLAERAAARPTQANFRTGHLTVCTLVPMRSVPHRVVCLLGLDDGAFPRRSPRDGEDVLLERPRVGERDGRSEDRQLLLDALMAAQERLIITYAGADERTGAARPPAVPVGELLDLIDASVLGPGAPARESVLIRHPLQPFHKRNFIPGALRTADSWSFDGLALDGARALNGPRRPPRPFLERPLPPLVQSEIELAELEQFLTHPVRAFLRRRLGLSLFERDEQLDDALAVELDRLGSWQIGRRLLEARLSGVEGRTAWLAEIARGDLPPGELGRPVLIEVYSAVEAIFQTVSALRAEAPIPVDVHLELDRGRTLTGTIPGLSGQTLLSSSYSRLAPAQRLVAWARLLALSAAEPERAWSAATVGRGDRGVAVARIGPLGENAAERRALALEQLDALLDLRARGMREPLPIFCRTSAAFAAARAAGADPLRAAASRWRPESHAGEDQQPEHRLVLGGVVALDELLALAPAEDEHGPGWDPSTTSRFARLACRLWDGLLEHEELGGR